MLYSLLTSSLVDCDYFFNCTNMYLPGSWADDRNLDYRTVGGEFFEHKCCTRTLVGVD